MFDRPNVLSTTDQIPSTKVATFAMDITKILWPCKQAESEDNIDDWLFEATM